jgi:hypothetical protein
MLYIINYYKINLTFKFKNQFINVILKNIWFNLWVHSYIGIYKIKMENIVRIK